jgi:DNA-binding LytR/AlgR family response regulator
MKPISESDKNYFFLKDKGALVKLYFDEICYLKSDHVYTEIFLKNEAVKVFRIGLNTIMEKLPEKFVRVHRSYIINYDYITKINTSSITINSETIPVGAKYKQSLFNKVSDF